MNIKKTKTTTPKKGTNYDSAIDAARAVIEEKKAEIKELLAAKLNENANGWEIGSVVYYPAPPQKKVIPCRLEIEENSDGDIVYFARPICVDKKTGEETLSKRHYSLGMNLDDCDELYKEMPELDEAPKKTRKKGKKNISEEEDSEEEATVVNPVKKKMAPRKKLGVKLGKK